MASYNTHLDNIRRHKPQYFRGHPDHRADVVFRSCHPYILVLQRLSGAKTTEHRSGIFNARFAKMKGINLQILEIFTKTTPEKNVGTISVTVQDRKTELAAGQTLVREIDGSQGLCYFKSLEVVFFHGISYVTETELNFPLTGYHCEWYDNGSIRKVTGCVEGKHAESGLNFMKTQSLHRSAIAKRTIVSTESSNRSTQVESLCQKRIIVMDTVHDYKHMTDDLYEVYDTCEISYIVHDYSDSSDIYSGVSSVMKPREMDT